MIEDFMNESLDWAKKFEGVFKDLQDMPREEFIEKLKKLTQQGEILAPDCKEKEILLDLNQTTVEMMNASEQLKTCDPKEKGKLDREWQKCAAYGAFLILMLAGLKPHEKIVNQKKGPKHPYQTYVEESDDDPWKLN